MVENAVEKERNDNVLYEHSLMTDDDLYLFNEGSHFRLYDKLGAHPMEYGGSGMGNFGGKETMPVSAHGRPFSLNLTLPPLAAIYFKFRGS